MEISPIKEDLRKKLDIRPGDTVRVWQKIQEKDKTRLQPFEGLVLARRHGTEAGATFTVRRSTGGYGVEKIFPLYSPMIDRVEIIKRSKVKRSKLLNIRRQALKQISKRMKMMFVDIKQEEEEKPIEVVTDTTKDKEKETPNAEEKEVSVEVTEEKEGINEVSEEKSKENTEEK